MGVARHSETLEELVVYKCLYENSSGELWVRPKELFEGVLENGAPRFAAVELSLQCFDHWLEDPSLLALAHEVFAPFEEGRFREELQSKKVHLLIAKDGETLVGFKLGYEESPQIFYSWLGAVHPEWRGRGVGKALMKAQHEWALKQGYQRLKTKTLNRWKDMLLLNIRSGFEIVGTETRANGELKLILEKAL